VLHAVLPPGPGDVRSKKKPDKCEKGIEKMFKSVLKNLDKKKTRDAAMPLMALGKIFQPKRGPYITDLERRDPIPVLSVTVGCFILR